MLFYAIEVKSNRGFEAVLSWSEFSFTAYVGACGSEMGQTLLPWKSRLFWFLVLWHLAYALQSQTLFFDCITRSDTEVSSHSKHFVRKFIFDR